MATSLDVSHIPSTPYQLFAQWGISQRVSRRAAVAAFLISIWDAATGPPATQQEWWQHGLRNIA